MGSGCRLSSKNSVAFHGRVVDFGIIAMTIISRTFASLVLLQLLLCFPVAMQGAVLDEWTLEDVLARMVESNGGQEAIEEITNLRIRGKIVSDKGTQDFVLLKKRPNKTRIQLMFKGRSREAGFDGITGWQRVSQGNEERVVPIEGEDLARMERDADFDGPLVGEPQSGVACRLLGVERIDRVDYFVVEVAKSNSVGRHYIDSRTFREDKVLQTVTLNSGEEVETQTQYFEYKRFGGIWVAMRTERWSAGDTKETILINSVDLNPGILDRAFARPEE